MDDEESFSRIVESLSAIHTQPNSVSQATLRTGQASTTQVRLNLTGGTGVGIGATDQLGDPHQQVHSSLTHTAIEPEEEADAALCLAVYCDGQKLILDESSLEANKYKYFLKDVFLQVAIEETDILRITTEMPVDYTEWNLVAQVRKITL